MADDGSAARDHGEGQAAEGDEHALTEYVPRDGDGGGEGAGDDGYDGGHGEGYGDGYGDEAAEYDGAGGGADGDEGGAGRRGHWGYGGDDYVDGAGPDMGDEEQEEEEEEEEEEDIEFEIPTFANEANKELNREIIATHKSLQDQAAVAREHKERVVIMREHLKNVQAELTHTQSLLESKTREIKSEDHLKQLAEREVGRIRQETRKLDTSAEEVQDQMNVVQNSIFKGSEKLEQFKVSMSFNQEELEQWAIAAKQKEEDNLALERYTRADEAKIKELTLALEKLTTAVAMKKQELEREVTETQAKQIELDKTAEEFRQLHRERQELVRQWQDAIEAMKRRDDEIAAAAEKFASEKERIRARQDALAQQGLRLKQMLAENDEFEAKILARARSVAKQREEYMTAQAKLSEFKDEVEVLKNELQKAAADLMTLRSQNANYNIQVEEQHALLEAARQRYHATNRKLSAAAKDVDKVEAVASRREEELKEQEYAKSAVDKELAVLKEKMFKQSQELFKLRQEESNLIAEIAGSQAAAKNLASKIHKLDQESLRQQELVYSAEFQIQQMERKVARASGERSDEEKKQLQARIAELTTEMENAALQEKNLTQQSKRLQEELRRTKRRQVQLDQQLESLASRATEIQLQNSSTEDSLKKALKDKEEVMVSHDVLKLEVRKLRGILSGRADEVFGLENRKAQLEMSMEERKRAIDSHMEAQRAQAKLMEEERHKVAMDHKARLAKVSVLQAKFETLCARMKSEDESGEERSQAYFVIKAAQKREELQREGDELDANIRRCERETKALVATLKSLNVGNTNYRLSNHKADLGSMEGEQLRKLEAQSKAAADLLFRRKRDLQRIAGEAEEEADRLQQLEEQIVTTHGHLDHLHAAKAKAEDEEADTRSAIEAMEREVESLSAEHKISLGLPADSGPTPDEIAFRATAIADTNSNVLFTLGQLAKEFPELQPTLQACLEEHGLRMPARPPSRAPTGV